MDGTYCQPCNETGMVANFVKGACEPCPPATEPKWDRSSCQPCEGKNFSAFGAECKPCLAGSEADEERTHCLPCGRGFGGAGCEDCLERFYNFHEGHSECRPCVPGGRYGTIMRGRTEFYSCATVCHAAVQPTNSQPGML